MIHFTAETEKVAPCGSKGGLCTSNSTLVECPTCQKYLLAVELENKIRETYIYAQNTIKPKPKTLDSEQKIGLGLFLFCLVVAATAYLVGSL